MKSSPGGLRVTGTPAGPRERATSTRPPATPTPTARPLQGGPLLAGAGQTCAMPCCPVLCCVNIWFRSYNIPYYAIINLGTPRCKPGFHGDGFSCEPAPRFEGNFLMVAQVTWAPGGCSWTMVMLVLVHMVWDPHCGCICECVACGI